MSNLRNILVLAALSLSACVDPRFADGAGLSIVCLDEVESRCFSEEQARVVMAEVEPFYPAIQQDMDLVVEIYPYEEPLIDMGDYWVMGITYTERYMQVASIKYLAHELAHVGLLREFGDGDSNHSGEGGPWHAEDDCITTYYGHLAKYEYLVDRDMRNPGRPIEPACVK